MPLLTVLLVLVAVGIVLWLVNKYIPMNGTIKTILNVVIIGITIYWLLKGLGILTALSSVKI
jgi:hypothetical protein